MAKPGKVLYDGVLAARVAETDEGYLLQVIYNSKVLFAFFDGLIPEGWLLDITVEYRKVKANGRFEL